MGPVDRYYRHSGHIGMAGFLCIPFVGTLGTLVMGIIYAYAIFYIPFVYLNVLLTLGLGGLVGLLIGKAARLGKVRSAVFALVIGLSFGLFADYVAWVTWIFVISGRQALVLSPLRLLVVIKSIAAEGAWSMSAWKPTGVTLYAIWTAEAAIIAAPAAIIPWRMLKSAVFCERCGRWVEQRDSMSLVEPVAGQEDLRQQLEQGDYTFLKEIKRVDVQNDAFTTISLLRCPTCEQLHTITVKSVVARQNAKGEKELKEYPIVENLLIDAETHRIVKSQMEPA